MVEENTSAWQMGNRTLERINNILNECKIARSAAKYEIWYDSIISLHLEVLPFLCKNKDGMREDIQKKLDEVTVNISMYNAKLSNVKKLKEDLLYIEGQLRISLLKFNLLIPKMDDPRAAIFKT